MFPRTKRNTEEGGLFHFISDQSVYFSSYEKPACLQAGVVLRGKDQIITSLGKIEQNDRRTQKHLPGQFFPEVNELSVGAVLTDQGKFDAGLGSIHDLHLGVLRAQFGLHPSRMS